MPCSLSRRNRLAPAAVLLAVAAVAGCSSRTSPALTSRPAPLQPERILAAPKDALSASVPQPDGTAWVLAGPPTSRGLFRVSLSSGGTIGSISVSGAAQSVTESQTGVLGLALGNGQSGALQLLNGSTGTLIKTVPLGAPARDVVVGSDGTTFYVLNGTGSSSSVTIVNSQDGRVQGTVPVPLDTVSVVPGEQQTTIFALQPDGRVSQIAVAGGKVMAGFQVGGSGDSLALSPDGSTLYALKDGPGADNVAVVSLATESVRQVLPAPSDCLQVIVSPDGSQLYEVVGTMAYGNIQVFAI